ncbi:MAG: glycosyltransferase family 1 protein [Leptospiraceae bacterium]|nr:glycosyltransferase family 1 protein [Leptospiraceae bacterium]MDW7975244.1 glycosyltransferase family 1 protein [Leptospiraceae bacterium]
MLVYHSYRKNSSRPIKIAFITDTYPPDVNGVAHSLYQIIQILKQHHEILVLRPEDDLIGIKIQPHIKEVFFPYLNLPFYKEVKLGLPFYQRVYDSIKAFSPDVVHIVTEGPLGFMGLLVARQLGITVVSDYRTNFTDYLKFYNIEFLSEFIKYYLIYFHNQCDLNFVPTREIKIQLKKQGINNLKVLGRGVDIRNFHYSKYDEDFRKEWNVKKDDLLFLYVGRIALEKNLELVCDVFRSLKKKYPFIHLMFVGDGPYRSTLEQEYKEILFLGAKKKEELSKIYASSDLFLFPSKTETFGNVVLEAYASGLPIIAYSYAASKLIYQHKKTGILIPFHKKNSHEVWYQYLEQLIKHPNRLKKLKMNIKNEYHKLKKFTWEGISALLLKHYYELLKQKRKKKIINL